MFLINQLIKQVDELRSELERVKKERDELENDKIFIETTISDLIVERDSYKALYEAHQRIEEINQVMKSATAATVTEVEWKSLIREKTELREKLEQLKQSK